MKSKILITITAGLLLLLVVSPAIPAGDESAAGQAKGAGQKDVKGPPVLEQVTFVNTPYWSSPPWYPPSTETDDYRLVMGGLRWLAADPMINCVVYTKDAPVSGAFAAISPCFDTWDNATLAAIYGTITENSTDDAPGIVADGVNTISWGPIDGPGGVIGVTNFWYWPNTKELVEFDMVLDSAESWSVTGESDKFDVQNVTTHELGHTLALDDLRSPRDGALTMHAYTWPGDIGKRSLGSGDILGIQAIYGE